MHDLDEARRQLGHMAWLRGSDYATVLSGAQIESEAVRDLAVETSVVEIARGVPKIRAVPTTKATETLSPKIQACNSSVRF